MAKDNFIRLRATCAYVKPLTASFCAVVGVILSGVWYAELLIARRVEVREGIAGHVSHFFHSKTHCKMLETLKLWLVAVEVV